MRYEKNNEEGRRSSDALYLMRSRDKEDRGPIVGEWVRYSRIEAEQRRRGGGTRRWHGTKGGVTSVRRVLQRRLLQLPSGSVSPPAHTHIHTYGTSVCGYHPPPARIRVDACRSRPTESWTVIGDVSSPRIVDLSLRPWTHAPLRQPITRIIITRQLHLPWARVRRRRRRGLPHARRRGGISCAVGEIWMGKGKRVWMKSEEEDEDKGRTRGGPRGGRAADSRPKLRVVVAVRERGCEWCDVDAGRACVCGSQPRVLVVLSALLLFPAVVLQHLPHFYASDGGVGRRGGVGFAAHGDAAKAARDRSSSPSSSSPSPSPSICAPRFYRRRYADTSPGSATRKEGGPARINAHKRGTRRGGRVSTSRPPVHSPAQASAVTPSPSSTAQRISDAVVAHLRPCSLPRPLLYTIGDGITIPAPTKTDDTSGRKPVRIGTHFDGAEARRLSGSGRRGREALNGARWGGETLRGGADVDAELQGERSTVGGGWDDTSRYEYKRRGCCERGRATYSFGVRCDSEGYTLCVDSTE
ncbi:hypothetical protein B0H14DRAFT_3787925 [Mycena olivaceomarginata]|nr:hypothetical protein B0H14DRAFT_3787925 [Mycena olivaceomarginata]